MPLPRLIHPVAVQVSKLQRSTTVVDADYREEVENVDYAAPVTINGQIRWEQDDRLRPSKLGIEEGSDGYVLFMLRDLRRLGLEPICQGDKIESIGVGPNRVATNVYVVFIKYMGHMPRHGGPSMVKAFFKDRHPAKASGAGIGT